MKNDKPSDQTTEELRLAQSARREAHWKRWGPYLSERQWGTVREDYSPDGTAWEYLPHDHARSRAYRWGEDGIGGISDRHQLICFALALWNGRDPVLKERLFGLSGHEGNHGEDVKECYYYLDSTPTHSYMKFLYKYPQAEFPYARLRMENFKRDRGQPEYELIDTGVFDEDRYFDVFIEYAKAGVEDICIRVTALNRAREPADLHLLPTLWCRNTWSWGIDDRRPQMSRVTGSREVEVIALEHPKYGSRRLYCEGAPRLLFVENETNFLRLFGASNHTPWVKDGIHDYLIDSVSAAVNPGQTGTKASAHYPMNAVPAGGGVELKLRFTDQDPMPSPFGRSFEEVFAQRIAEADAFYRKRLGSCNLPDLRLVQRQAFAGMLWSKQFYHYDVRTWLMGDPAGPPPPAVRRRGRNHDWTHLYNSDVISMPDKWEYPWYAAWDLAFHCIPIALIDPDFAKEQLILFLREWYMHPNGQLPAYEWELGNVNPPVHAWAAWRVYKIERRMRGKADREFLARVFHKLLLNFTWWVNRKDPDGLNVFQGGFLGLDNIGVFDRSEPLPAGGHIEQSDATSWMGMYCLNMLMIALELATEDKSYEDVASKFFEHFVYIARAMNNLAGEGVSLWEEEDGFYYDVLHFPGDRHYPVKLRSVVGLIPLFAAANLEPQYIEHLPGFKSRMQWFLENASDVTTHFDTCVMGERGTRRLLAIVNRERLLRVLRYMLDEREFLSPYGIRSLSRIHLERPYALHLGGNEHRVGYEPAESATGLFGGNSNWRGPIWFPLNFLLIESLQRYHHFFGNGFKVEYPTGSGHQATLWEVSVDISRRLARLFIRDKDGRRPMYGAIEKFQSDPHWKDLILFYEYFHADDGRGLGASHQTGWTGLVAKLLEQSGA